ncbi:MAG: PIN domain-containing protein [Verrucomicrobia bacterium]|nr:PIN domain-containing protein [Verrucomicrobiota bacterium]
MSVLNAIPRKSLSDANDNAFLEVALSARADCLVTGNIRHFPRKLRYGMTVLSPREFLELFRNRPT